MSSVLRRGILRDLAKTDILQREATLYQYAKESAPYSTDTPRRPVSEAASENHPCRRQP